MSTTKHAPGPWTVVDVKGTWCVDLPLEGRSKYHRRIPVGDDRSSQANAALIAAAPDLLSIARLAQQISTIDVNDFIGRAQIVALQGTLAALCKLTLAKAEVREVPESVSEEV